MWLFNREKKYLPMSTGPFVPGCTDIMLGYSETSLFFRLFYPTDADKNSETQNKRKWIPWFPDDDYLRGISKVIMLFTPIFRLLLWYYDEYLVPVLYGERVKSTGKMRCIVMSHGLGGNRFLCSNICYELASHGFLVASLEHKDLSACHTYYYSNKNEVQNDKRTSMEFKHIPFGKNHYEQRFQQIKKRSQDCRLVAEFFKKLKEGDVPENVLQYVPSAKGNQFELGDLIGRIELDGMGVMGHSFGGATALYALSECQEFRYGIVLDPWMFPIKNENLHEKLDQPILFVNTQTFHIQSNVEAMSKLLTSDDRKMFTILHTTHENQCDNAIMLGCWLNLFMKKLDPLVAMKINNALLLQFLHQYLGSPEEVEECEYYLEEQKDNIRTGLTKPWA